MNMRREIENLKVPNRPSTDEKKKKLMRKYIRCDLQIRDW